MRSLLFSLLLAGSCLASEPFTLPLWPGGAPSPLPHKSEATAQMIQKYGGVNATRLSDITDPTIAVYRPEKPNGTAIIVAPGGGFMFLSYAHEGTQVAEWLNTIGVTAVVLKYRTPTRDAQEPFALPVQDAQRALGLVRHHAAEWGINPERVGLLGFSAGANLAGHAAWDDATPRTYPQVPELDDPRGPSFLVFIYGGGFVDKAEPTKFRAGFQISPKAPPAFS